MPKFIKLLARDANKVAYIDNLKFEYMWLNCNNITAFQTDLNNKNFIVINDTVFECKETPEEILKLIAECED